MPNRMSINAPGKALTLALALAASLVLLPLAAHAINLDQAKNQAMVCEQPNGYLKPTGSATPEVSNLVKDINSKRKAEYARIAEEHGVTAEEVGILTAKKLEPKCK